METSSIQLPDQPSHALETSVPAPTSTAKPSWAMCELGLAAALMVAGFSIRVTAFRFGPTPWLPVIGLVSLWTRGSGRSWMDSSRRGTFWSAVCVGALVGIGYQFLGTFTVEPIVARLTSNRLPDVSAFRSIVGSKAQLGYWIAISWTLAAFAEEIAYRGWILGRLAELGRYSRSSWIAAMIVSSVLFGALHGYQGLSGMIATGLTGLVFAGLYIATGRNLVGPIVAHGMLDTTAFFMIYLGVYPGL